MFWSMKKMPGWVIFGVCAVVGNGFWYLVFFNFYFFSNLSSSLSVEDLGLGAIDRTSSCQGRLLFIWYLSLILVLLFGIPLFQFDVVTNQQLEGIFQEYCGWWRSLGSRDSMERRIHYRWLLTMDDDAGWRKFRATGSSTVVAARQLLGSNPGHPVCLRTPRKCSCREIKTISRLKWQAIC